MIQNVNRYWIAGAVAGLVVLVWLWASTGLLAGILMGLITAGLVGGLLVWGLGEGPGSTEENKALRATYWEPEAFTPSRRVVAAGGKVVSQQPLSDAQELGDAAPLQSTTLQASRDPAASRLVDRPMVTADDLPAPDGTTALLATPSLASVIPVEPVVTPTPLAAQTGTKAAAPGTLTDETAGFEPAAVNDGVEPASDPNAHPIASDVAIGPDRVVTVTDDRLNPAPDDELMLIEGVGPMQAAWLRDNGVSGLADVSAWDEADLSRFAGMMGRDGHRIRTEDWQGQAARLVDAMGHGS